MAGCDAGSIDFENVKYSYHRGMPVLRGLTFSVGGGQMVALVGFVSIRSHLCTFPPHFAAAILPYICMIVKPELKYIFVDKP